MREEIIVSGRNNPLIDPLLHVWHWEIPVYLFLGGLAAGLMFFAALYTIRNRENNYKVAVQIAPMFASIALILGLGALFLDLHHKLYFWRLYTTIRLASPMSWGAWILMIVTPISFIWSALHIKSIFPNWDWKFEVIEELLEFFTKYKKVLAWIMLISSAILGIYTGILLSAFNARPLWNTSIMGPLFLASGLSAGTAMVIWISKNHDERKRFAQLDLMIIGIELFLIIHMFMGFLASTQVQIDAANLFLGGEYTASFWIFVVILGMIVPAILEGLELKGYKIPIVIPAILVLFGSVMLRIIISYAGQASRWLY
ncbi:NrfD/PsrC family molybdoenzyme membrane anchor subunit [Ancylomarina longa]|uniref:Nitrite reductase n=1 Tax=Ancylomarina longa TaxID=2487017 RepID=A0A434AF39_9BACT|nr:NrfD/PsrC family molybdoenzyme membrane anchor subunit [Ancylomarina longa]RUT72996.1 nitrite reductase [Ancylomarina longa]